MTDIVWDQTLDQGQYRGRVERTEEYRGVLIVTRTSDEKELLREEVGLSYAARFGPDVDDVAQWQDKTVTAVDAFVGREIADAD